LLLGDIETQMTADQIIVRDKVELARVSAYGRSPSDMKVLPMIHVVALITAQPGQLAAVLAAFRENMPAVHAEAGCIAYQPVVDTPDVGAFQAKIGPDSFIVLETWESADALRAHAAAPHMAEYGRKVKGMLANRTIHVLSPA